jgi:hypothetical protein
MSARRIVVALLLSVTAASAVDHPQEAKKLVVKDVGGKQSLVWTTKLPAPMLPATSPFAFGATLRVATSSGESASFHLPPSGWSVNDAGTVYKFKNPQAPAGPSEVKVAVLAEQKLVKVSAKASGITLDEPTQGTVSVQLGIGTDVYCSECTTPVHDEAGRYAAKLCPAPASCPTGFCGNGVIDQASEECDLPDPGICDDYPLPFAIACDPADSPAPCTCCGISQCILSAGFTTRCCGGAQCQDTTGAGMVRGGACIPPTCTQSSECNGYECVDGHCCGQAGSFCGVVDCCPGSGATCSIVFASQLCCRPAGGSCADPLECCSYSCTGGLCD